MIELIKPNFLDKTFLPKKYVKNTKNVEIKAIGNLTANSLNLPKIFIDAATIQKYKGGFSKNGTEFNKSKFQSFELDKSLDMIAYLVSSTSNSG